MKYCDIRPNDSAIAETFNGTDCFDHFEVSKFTYNLFIGYRFVLKSDHVMPDDTIITFDPSLYEMLYRLTFNESISDYFDLIYIILNSQHRLPLYEIGTAPVRSRGLNYTTKNTASNVFGTNYHQIKVINLKSPYTTNCTNYSSADCFMDCVNNQTVTQFNRLSLIKPHIRGNLKLISQTDLTNRSKDKKYVSIIKRCRKNCSANECEPTELVTEIRNQEPSWDFMVFTKIPALTSLIVENKPKIVIMDFMTLVASCFGTWFGISVIGLYPFKFTLQWKKKSSRIATAVEGGEKFESKNECIKMWDQIDQLSNQNLLLKNQVEELNQKFNRATEMIVILRQKLLTRI